LVGVSLPPTFDFALRRYRQTAKVVIVPSDETAESQRLTGSIAEKGPES
jgi:hypothetical protein